MREILLNKMLKIIEKKLTTFLKPLKMRKLHSLNAGKIFLNQNIFGGKKCGIV